MRADARVPLCVVSFLTGFFFFGRMEQPVDAMSALEARLLKLEGEIERVEDEIADVVRQLKPLEKKPLKERDQDEKEEIARLSKEKEQLRKEKEQLRKEKEQLRKEKEQLREKENKLLDGASVGFSAKSLRKDGFPPMSSVAEVSDAPSSSSSHKPAEVTIGAFGCSDKFPKLSDTYNSALWTYFSNFEHKEFPLTTEASVSTLVEMAMNDLLCEIGAQTRLRMVREKQGFLWEPDLTVFAGINPIGGIEVKKELSPRESAPVVGEIFDQLMHFKHHWGIEAPFVILTSYRQWRVFWLDDSESNDQAKIVCDFNVQSPGQTPTPVKSISSNPEHHVEKVDLGKVSALGLVFDLFFGFL